MAVRHQHAIFRLVIAFATERLRQGLADAFTIFGVHLLQNAVGINPLRLRKAKQRAPFDGRPDFVSHEVPNPDAKVRGFGGESHSLFAFAQLPPQLRGAEHIAAQLVAHG